jgi:hypothetical protein
MVTIGNKKKEKGETPQRTPGKRGCKIAQHRDIIGGKLGRASHVVDRRCEVESFFVKHAELFAHVSDVWAERELGK